MATLPDDPKERKRIPLFSGLLAYFPAALCEVAKVSLAGNEQHNPGKPLHWDRSKSGDELDAALRHMLDSGRDTDGQYHRAKACWRLLACLQKELEEQGAPLPPGAVIAPERTTLDELYRQRAWPVTRDEE